MDIKLQKKFDESSIENDLLDFLDALSHVSFSYALIGGTACGGYTGHLPRRHSDIDILIDKNSSIQLENFLINIGFKEQTKNSIVRMFFRNDTYFHIDVLTDNLYLANSPDWQVLASYCLKSALATRQIVSIFSLDRLRKIEVHAISREYLFLMKLFPPIEASNTHDLIYLTLSYKNQQEFTSTIRSLLHNEKYFKDYLLKRLNSYITILPHCIWFKTLDKDKKEFIKTLWLSLI